MNTKSKALVKNNPTEKQVILTKNEDIKKHIGKLRTGYEPDSVLEHIQGKVNRMKDGRKGVVTTESDLYKALTLFEFDKGVLMAAAVPDRCRTFAVDFYRNLQKEYQCVTPSEKATAELVTINFVRTLEIQHRINLRLEQGEFGEIGVKYLAILSKELDRANRHYLNSLQTLKMIKQPMLEVNIKTQTAVVGQNQIVQTNNK